MMVMDDLLQSQQDVQNKMLFPKSEGLGQSKEVDLAD